MRLARWCLMLGVPLLAGLFSIWQGRDANWDFLNYRWYNPYAFLHGRLRHDMLVAGHATFFNPVLELPFYLIATHVPAIVAGFYVAALDGACFVPLFLLGERTLTFTDPRHRTALAALLALAGLTGGGALGQIGIVSWDMGLGILTFSSLLVLVSNGQKALRSPSSDATNQLLLAGFLAGSAAGLKLTAAIYPLGIVAGLTLAGSGTLRDRALRDVWFCIGAGTGIILFGGLWMIRLYGAFENPLMPFFNGVFHSPYAPEGSNRDTSFMPQGLASIAAFPFRFTANSRLVAEYDFRDAHIALAYALALISLPFMLLRRTAEGLMARPAAILLAVTFLTSYAAWLFLFAIYRYILPLEMLGLLTALGGISLLPLPRRLQTGVIVGMVVISTGLVRAGFDRLPWTGHYVEIALPMTVPDNAMVLMTGGNPAGFVVTALPPSVPVLRAGSALAHGDRFGPVMEQRIRIHEGPFYTILAAGDESVNAATLQGFGLVRNEAECKPIVSNTSENLRLCPVIRP